MTLIVDPCFTLEEVGAQGGGREPASCPRGSWKDNEWTP